MASEDVISLATSSPSGFEDENNEVRVFDGGDLEADCQPNNCDNKEDKSMVQSMELSEDDVEAEDGQIIEQKKREMSFVDDPSIPQVSNKAIGLTETVIESDSTVDVQSGGLDVQSGGPNVQNGSPIRSRTMDVSSISGVKRARMTFDEQQPSVHINYKSLTRASKQKLEELLQQWSEWEAQNGSSLNDSNEATESGEETYFPAICIGTKKGSAVSFWIDNQTKDQQNEGFIPLDSNTAPLYDRGYALGLTLEDGLSNLEGGLEIIDNASRCFNCGSYSHSLKGCPKPRDNVAVNNARKQHKSKRNQNSGSRIPTRYYQNSVGGRFDGLRPGALDAETRKLLGLGELDPPPWLNRMRELGYPPGYLDPDDEDQPSGIIIYADGEIKEDQEDGEIVEIDTPELQRKMTVEFPGINAPIPENADERLWAPGPSNSDLSRDRSHHRSNHHSESISRGHHRDQRWSRDYRDDGPPGVDLSSSYPPRYGSYDYGHSSLSRSPTLARSHSERGRRSPLVYEDYMTHSSRSSPYSFSDRYTSPSEHPRFEDGTDRYRDDYNLDHSSRGMDEYDRHRHRSSRW